MILRMLTTCLSSDNIKAEAAHQRALSAESQLAHAAAVNNNKNTNADDSEEVRRLKDGKSLGVCLQLVSYPHSDIRIHVHYAELQIVKIRLMKKEQEASSACVIS